MTLPKPHQTTAEATPATSDKVRAIDVAEKLALAAGAIVTMAFAGKLLMRANLSFDFTDEGFYLNWISHPSNFRTSLTQFGYIYHPLYELTGSSIASLRQGNILISFLLAMTACLCLLRRRALDEAGQFTLSWPQVALSIVAASSSLLILVFASALWLPTPSYNSLTFQGLLVTAIGFSLAEAHPSRVSVAGWLLIGLGGFFAFMGKPTSAAALGVVTLFGLVIAGRLSLRTMTIAVVTSSLLLGTYAWLIDGSIAGFIQGFRRSIEASSMLEERSTIGAVFRFDAVDLAFQEICILAALTLGIVALTLCTYSSRFTLRFAAIGALWVQIAFALGLTTGLFGLSFHEREFQGLQFGALALAGMLCFPAISLFTAGSRVSRQQLPSWVFFVLLPLAFVAGTANNYWRVLPSAAFFFTLSSFSLIGASSWARTSWRHLLPLAVSSLVMTVVIVEHGMQHPYRDPSPLTSSTVKVKIGEAGQTLEVNPSFASYLEALHELAGRTGLQPGTPVIDLTGHYPGSLYAIGAKPVGAPWLIGGPPGSERLATSNLDVVACSELVRSWILTEPEGPLRLSPNLLQKYGLELQRDFERLGTLDTPIGGLPKSYKQELFKPKPDMREPFAACEKARAGSN